MMHSSHYIYGSMALKIWQRTTQWARWNPLPQLDGLLFLISSKSCFKCTIPQIEYHITWPLLYQLAEIAQSVHHYGDTLHHERILTAELHITPMIWMKRYFICWHSESWAHTSRSFCYWHPTWICWQGVKCSCMVECLPMVGWVFGSIPHDGPTELFLIPASTSQLV